MRLRLRSLWLAGLLAAIAPANTFSQPAKQLAKVNLGYVPSVDQITTMIGVNNGIFEKHGVDLRLSKPFPTGVDILNAMQTGALDIGTVGLPFVGASLAGMDIVVVGLYTGSAVKARSDQSYAMIAAKDSGIDPKNLRTLSGKKIGVTFSSTNQFYAYNLLKENGVTPEAVNLINTAPGDMAVALQTRGVDAFASWEPWPVIGLQAVEGSYEVARGGGYTPNIGYIVARGDFVRSQPDVVERFLRAHFDAAQFARTHLDDDVEVASLWYPSLKQPAMRRAVEYTAPLLDPRISACNYMALLEQFDITLRIRNAQMLPSFKLADKVDPKFVLKIEKSNPELFSDLPPVAAAAKLGDDGTYHASPEAKAACAAP